MVAALDSYSYMQSLNGCWGDMTAWDGVGATTTFTSSPYERANAQCSPIEDASTLCNMANSEFDPSGVTFLNESAHADGVWADPTGSTIAIKHNGEKLDMVLHIRPL